MSYSDVVMADNPSGYWKCDDAVESGVLADSSGNGHDMTLSGGATLGAEGLLNADGANGGTSLLLDGVDGIAVLNEWPSGIADWPVTLEAWVEVQGDGGYGAVWMGDHNEGDRSFRLQTNSANFAAAARFDSGSATASVETATGKRVVHVVGVFVSATERHIYLNGALGATDTESRNFPSTAVQRTAIGARYSDTPNSYLEGRVGHVAIYNSALSPQRIRAHYLAGQNTTLAGRIAELGPVAHYKLDDTEGTTATDSSGNDNHGTISGGVTLGADPLAWSDGTSRSMAFDGVDGRVKLPAMSFGSEFSAFALISPADMGTSRPLSLNDQAPFVFIEANHDTTNNARVFFYDGTGVEIDFELNVGRTTSVLISAIENDAVSVYANGALVGSAAIGAFTQLAESTEENNHIGAGRNDTISHAFTGWVDDCAVFDRALTAADAFALAERVVQKTYRQTAIAMGAEAVWPVDETTGATAEDATGNGNDGTYVSATLAQEPLIAETGGYSVSLPEVDGAHITIPQLADGKDAFAFAGWVDNWVSEAGENHYIVNFRSASRLANLRIRDADKIRIAVKQGNTGDVVADADFSSVGGPVLVTGIWDNVVGQMQVYINASLGVSSPFSGFSGVAPYGAVIGGNYDGTLSLDADLDVPAFFGFAPTPAQISALYYRGTVAAEVALTLDGTAFAAGVPVERTFRAHLASDGSVIGETTSSSADGSWSMPRESTEAIDVIGLPGEGEAPLVMRVPAIES